MCVVDDEESDDSHGSYLQLRCRDGRVGWRSDIPSTVTMDCPIYT